MGRRLPGGSRNTFEHKVHEMICEKKFRELYKSNPEAAFHALAVAADLPELDEITIIVPTPAACSVKPVVKFWVVFSLEPTNTGATKPIVHCSHSKAKERAREVAALNPGVKVFIAETTSAVESEVKTVRRPCV
jgi:hypothetical protein